ncbi:lactonase family protein [Pedobacter sp. JCM 36344]|uniref:lactonase family protein n=1 Tax=Pedobacter sp. JCM 36344 TaxID=3374280 RepID=UPI003978277A
MTKLNFVIGCYTSPTSDIGLSFFEFCSDTIDIQIISTLQVANPSYCLTSGDLLLAVNESGTDDDKITVLNISNLSAPKILGQYSSNGSSPCYISADKDLNHAFVANYGSGSLSVRPFISFGILGTKSQVVNELPKANCESNFHAVILSPDNKFLLVTNLGTDTISVFQYNKNAIHESVQTSSVNQFIFKERVGPRHLIFSNDGEFVYVIGEINANIYVFKWNNGILKLKQEVPLMNKDYMGANSAADLHLMPSGDFLLASNRGDANQIAVFSVNKVTGELTYSSSFDTGGVGPRNFAVDPTGNFVFAANQYSNQISIFRFINLPTVQLKLLKNLTLPSPVFIKFF